MKIYIRASADDSYRNKINREADEYINTNDAESADQFRQDLVYERDSKLKDLKKKFARQIDSDRLAAMFYEGGPYDTGDLTDAEMQYVDSYIAISDIYDPAIKKLRNYLNKYTERNYSRNKNFIGPKDMMTTLFYGE